MSELETDLCEHCGRSIYMVGSIWKHDSGGVNCYWTPTARPLMELDPEPWLNTHAGTRQATNADGWRVFYPRLNYSQRKERYQQ